MDPDTQSQPSRPIRSSTEFAGQVNRMFDRVAGRYDALNSVMTAGLHHRWRKRAAERTGLGPGDSALDVCCGTGDLALELAGRVAPGGNVIGCDFSEPMLDLAREKAVERGVDGVRFEWADALELPYDGERFDAVTVGFGVRNLADLDRGLREMARVLKPGGRLVILEITQPNRPPLSTFYSLWFDRAVPLLGSFSAEPEAYSYLPESVRSFPSPRGLAEKMDSAGMERIRYTVLAGGIIAIHSGIKG
jgi:demethylmenaquinone methyltransferase/2-methoxy-6-polyprenyl-1,4-benzoquinol methylase